MSRTTSQILGVEGQWVLSITLSSQKSKINQLLEFLLIEETGNLLPTWRISFVADKSLEKEWTETQEIPITLSQSTNSTEKIDTKLQIIRPSVTSLQGGLNTYVATGVLYAPAFTQTPYITITDPCNGTDVLQQIAKKHFSHIDTTKMTASKEVQSWIQSNTTDKKFLDYVVSHCYLPNNFVGVGITSDGTYRIVDVVKLSNSKEDYQIGGTSSNSLPLLASPSFNSNSGFMNYISGYNLDTPIISQDGGIRSVHRPQITFGFVNNKHSKVGEIQRKTLAPVKCSMSNDAKSYLAKANFDMGSALLSMEVGTVTVQTKYFPIKIWDVVNLLCPNTEQQGLNTNYSGRYVVTSVSRQIINNKLYTNLRINRDSHNETI